MRTESLTNNFRVTFNRSQINTANFFAGVDNVAGDLGITGISENPLNWGLPNLSFSDYSSLTDVAPHVEHDNTLQFQDTIIWNHAKHNVRFGGDYRRLGRRWSATPIRGVRSCLPERRLRTW